jgi:hypothetical protein
MVGRHHGFICRSAGWHGGADWLAAHRILLRRSVARRVKILSIRDLMEIPFNEGTAACGPSALGRATLTTPPFSTQLRRA